MHCPPFFEIVPNRVWRTYLGGRTLDEISGCAEPRDSHFPEDWLVSTTPAKNIGREAFSGEGVSLVRFGGGTVPLSELARNYPRELFGEKHLRRFGSAPGFLLKYLDSSIRLHMQCHPSAGFAKEHLNSDSGKAEGYYILGVRPGCEGYIYLGFQHPVDPAEFRRAILEQDIGKILEGFEKIPVRAGDSFYVPGGVPHAIGEGVFMVELMEPTDFAVRIEFERGGCVLPEAARFMGRDIDFGLSMFDFTARNREETKREFFMEPLALPLRGSGERRSLFDRRRTGCFRAESLRLTGAAELVPDSLTVLIVTSGSGLLVSGDVELRLNPFDRVLIPCKTPEVRITGSLELLSVMPPE